VQRKSKLARSTPTKVDVQVDGHSKAVTSLGELAQQHLVCGIQHLVYMAQRNSASSAAYSTSYAKTRRGLSLQNSASSAIYSTSYTRLNTQHLVCKSSPTEQRLVCDGVLSNVEQRLGNPGDTEQHLVCGNPGQYRTVPRLRKSDTFAKYNYPAASMKACSKKS